MRNYIKFRKGLWKKWWAHKRKESAGVKKCMKHLRGQNIIIYLCSFSASIHDVLNFMLLVLYAQSDFLLFNIVNAFIKQYSWTYTKKNIYCKHVSFPLPIPLMSRPGDTLVPKIKFIKEICQIRKKTTIRKTCMRMAAFVCSERARIKWSSIPVLKHSMCDWYIVIKYMWMFFVHQAEDFSDVTSYILYFFPFTVVLWFLLNVKLKKLHRGPKTCCPTHWKIP